MKTFDVQAISIHRPAEAVFTFVADPANLPQWTHAFARADDSSADMVTPSGTLAIGLSTIACAETGNVDWTMSMPDGSVGVAYSRVTPDGNERAIYSFVLMAPPVPLELLEGALAAQIGILHDELTKLKGILEA